MTFEIVYICFMAIFVIGFIASTISYFIDRHKENHAHWIKVSVPIGTHNHDTYICSNCFSSQGDKPTPYCNNCGAEMRFN